MTELDAILRTIREVETSLERRVERAIGVNLMIWGVVTASIFGFYQLVAWNHDAYHAMLGPTLSWVWIGPIAVGYVASALVGVRLGRASARPEDRRLYRRGLVPGAVASAVAAALILTGRTDLVYGALVLVTGVVFLAFGHRGNSVGRICLGLGAIFLAAGLALLLLRPPWMSLAAALVMGGGLFGTGTWLWRAAR